MEHKRIPVTLYPNKWKIFLLFLVCLGFTAIGIWMIRDGEDKGWFVAVIFGIGCVVFVGVLLPHSSYLRLSEQGFEVRSLFRGGFTPWKDAEPFGCGYIGVNKMVVFNYSPAHEKFAPGKKMAKDLTGFEGALPDTYGKSAEVLASLLNEWRIKQSLAISQNNSIDK